MKPGAKPRTPFRQRLGRLAGRVGRSLALSAALAAAACATLPESTLPRAPKPQRPTAADYEPARRAVREMRSVRRNPARMQAIEDSVRARALEAWNRMNLELIEETRKAVAESRSPVAGLSMKLQGYPPVLRSALIENFRTHHGLFVEANNVAGEILNRAGNRARVQEMLETGRPIAVYEGGKGFTLDLERGTPLETVTSIERALKPIAARMAEADARVNQRVEAFIRKTIDHEVELADTKAELERTNEELRKKLHGPK